MGIIIIIGIMIFFGAILLFSKRKPKQVEPQERPVVSRAMTPRAGTTYEEIIKKSRRPES